MDYPMGENTDSSIRISVSEALLILGNPKCVVTPSGAQAVCEALNVPWSADLVLEWASPAEAMAKYGFRTSMRFGAHVDVLQLGLYVCQHMMVYVDSKVTTYEQAAEICQRLCQRLKLAGVLQ